MPARMPRLLLIAGMADRVREQRHLRQHQEQDNQQMTGKSIHESGKNRG